MWGTGFTTDSYDLYVGIDSTTNNNQFVGSQRFWDVGSQRSSGVKLVEGTNNGTNSITLKSPALSGGDVTFIFPGTDGSNGSSFLQTDGSGNLSFGAPFQAFTLAEMMVLMIHTTQEKH